MRLLGIRTLNGGNFKEQDGQQLAFAVNWSSARVESARCRRRKRFARAARAALTRPKSFTHLASQLVTMARIILTGLQDQFIKFPKDGIAARIQWLGGQFREALTIFARADFVEHLAKTKDVGPRCARSLG